MATGWSRGILLIDADPAMVLTHVPMGGLPPGWVNLYGHLHNNELLRETPHIVTGYRTRELALLRWALQFGCDGRRTGAKQPYDHGVGIVLASAGGAGDRGQRLLGGRAAPGAIAPAHLSGDDGGANGLFGPPIGGVDGGVAQEREQRLPFRGQMLRETLHVGQWAGVEQWGVSRTALCGTPPAGAAWPR